MKDELERLDSFTEVSKVKPGTLAAQSNIDFNESVVKSKNLTEVNSASKSKLL